MEYLNIFKKYGINFSQNIDAFENHMQELKKRVKENIALNIEYEPWMAKQISATNWEIAEKFLADVFNNQTLPKIEVFLISTYITMRKGK